MQPKQEWLDAADKAADKYGLPRAVFKGLLEHESGWRPTVRSSAGAIGLGQLMPGTAKELGVNPLDPLQNIEGAARYLRKMTDQFGSLKSGIYAYNAGPGVMKAVLSGKRGFKPETQNYYGLVMGKSRKWGGGLGAAGAPTALSAGQPDLGLPQMPGLPSSPLGDAIAGVQQVAGGSAAPDKYDNDALGALMATSLGDLPAAPGRGPTPAMRMGDGRLALPTDMHEAGLMQQIGNGGHSAAEEQRYVSLIPHVIGAAKQTKKHNMFGDEAPNYFDSWLNHLIENA